MFTMLVVQLFSAMGISVNRNYYDRNKLFGFFIRFTAERLNRNSDRFNTLYGGLEPEVTNAGNV